MENFIYGSISGMFGVLISHPFDTIKTHIQQNKKIIYKPSSLYRGIGSPLIGVGFEKSIVFGTYNYIYNNLYENHVIAGGISGLSASLIVTPFEKLKINKQLNNRIRYNIKNLYSGFSITLTREIPGFSIYFSTYNYLKNEKKISNVESFLYGGISGLISWVFIYPQDRIKTFIQAENKKINILTSIKIISNKNMLHLYKGFHLALLRAIPLHAGTFACMNLFLP